MNANPKFLAATAHVDDAAVQPLPNSRKVYLGDLRVPMREITQTGDNPPILVYDTSGPYTDPAAKIDIRSGLPPLREKWIEARGDTEVLGGPTSQYGRMRLQDPKLQEFAFQLRRKPRRGKCVTQLHYARRGIVTPGGRYFCAGSSGRWRNSGPMFLMLVSFFKSSGSNCPALISASAV